MELKLFLRIIRKRLLLLIIIPVLSAVAMGCYSWTKYRPEYTAKTTLYVMNSSMSQQRFTMLEDLEMAKVLVNDYRELLKSRLITSTIIDELNLEGITPAGLAQRISVSSREGTRIIVISATYDDPEIARDIANKASKVFAERAVELMKVDNVETIDQALSPFYPTNSRSYQNVPIVFVMVIIAMIALILFLEYLDDTIKTREDIERNLGLTVLGTIPVFTIR